MDINNNINNYCYLLNRDKHNYNLLNKIINFINYLINDYNEYINYYYLKELITIIKNNFNERDYCTIINNSLSYLNNYFYTHDNINNYNDFKKILFIFGSIINSECLSEYTTLLYYLKDAIKYNNILNNNEIVSLYCDISKNFVNFDLGNDYLTSERKELMFNIFNKILQYIYSI